MSLQDKLDNRRKEFESSAPPEKLAIMHRATNDLRHSGIMEQVLKAGDRAPDFALPDDLRGLYSSFGIDLERFNGNDSWTLPMPGRFILDQQGTILSAEVDPDYTKRPEPSDIIKVLEPVLGIKA